MPTYVFWCPKCEARTSLFYKSLPSEAKQKGQQCHECEGPMKRDLGAEGFMAGGGMNFGVQKEVAMAMGTKDVGGQRVPVFTDENGKTVEVRGAAEVKQWMESNTAGKPRMVEWKNPITGQKAWVPQRTQMRADPVTGEPDERVGDILKGSAELCELDGPAPMPTVDSLGRPMKNGARQSGGENVPMRYLDPDTGKPFTIAGLMKGGSGGYAGGDRARKTLTDRSS